MRDFKRDVGRCKTSIKHDEGSRNQDVKISVLPFLRNETSSLFTLTKSKELVK